MMIKQEQNSYDSLCTLNEQERRIILAYRNGKASNSVNLLKDQGLLPSSFPTRPDRH